MFNPGVIQNSSPIIFMTVGAISAWCGLWIANKIETAGWLAPFMKMPAVMPLSDEMRRRIAYHEAGHAIIALHSDCSFPVKSISIEEESGSSGKSKIVIGTNKMSSLTRAQNVSMLVIYMGGRAAEEAIFGEDEVSGGAANDFEAASKIAENMALRYGMGKSGILLANTKKKNLSPKTRQLVEDDMQGMLLGALVTARRIIGEHTKELDALARALMQKGTLQEDDIQSILSSISINCEK